jgi:hypothetical protein
MRIDSNNFVVRQNDHLLIFDSYLNNRTLEEHYFTKPCASVYLATKFESQEEANEMISKVEDLDDVEVIQISQIEAEQKAKADKESDEVIKNAWSNTSYEKQKEMLDKIRETKGEQAVQDWLNKYGPLKDPTDSEE